MFKEEIRTMYLKLVDIFTESFSDPLDKGVAFGGLFRCYACLVASR